MLFRPFSRKNRVSPLNTVQDNMEDNTEDNRCRTEENRANRNILTKSPDGSKNLI